MKEVAEELLLEWHTVKELEKYLSVVALFDGAPSTLFEGIPSSRSDTL